MGRLVPRKGVDEVIAALRRRTDVELLVVGGGGSDSGVLEPTPTCAGCTHVRPPRGSRTRWLHGQVPRPMPAVLRSADAVVCAPWYEPFGIVPLEAMACGVPVVAAPWAASGTPWWTRTGLHVPPRRPEAIADAVRTLLAAPTQALAFGIAGRDRVLARYGWDRVAEATAAVYAEVVAERAGVGSSGRRVDQCRTSGTTSGKTALDVGVAR